MINIDMMKYYGTVESFKAWPGRSMSVPRIQSLGREE